MRRVVFPALTVFALVGLGCGQGAERASLKVGGGSPQRVEARERQEDAAALDEALTVARDRSPGAESLYRARLATAAQLPAERRAAAAAGIPLDPVRLAARLRVPAGDNAAELYRAFERAVRDSPLPPRTDEIAGRMGPGPTTVTPAEEARTSAVLARRSDLLVLISRITRRPECWFGYDLTRGFNVPTPEYAWMRRCARLLRGEAVRLARKGEAIRALTLLGQGFVIADHAAWQPGVIPYLVSVAIGSILLGGVDAVLQSAGSDPRVAATAAQTVAAWEPKLNLRRALADDAGLLCIGWAQVGQGDLRSLLTTGMVRVFRASRAKRSRASGRQPMRPR